MSETNPPPPLGQTVYAAQPENIESALVPALDLRGYELFERLGAGGMGEVYRCGDALLQRDLAIKVMKLESCGDAEVEQRFLREARITGALQHPSIVPIHQLGRLPDGRLCYTMKLVRGRTLADLIREEPPSSERLSRLLGIVEKACQAVAFAHNKGIIHRDLKPSNIMVGEFGEVQVMDWGLAKSLSGGEAASPTDEPLEQVETVLWREESASLSRAGAALGTPGYMPPEQAAGDWEIVDERTDVFALGAMLCEVLTGLPPYHGTDYRELMRRARRGDQAEALTRLDQCGADSALVQLCRECLTVEREQRPRHAGVVAERLADYQETVRERLRRAEVERAQAEVKMLEECKRRRLAVVLGLIALLLLSGGTAVWWQWQRHRAEVDKTVLASLAEARLLREQARSNPMTATAYEKAVAEARKAAEVARTSGVSEKVYRQAEEWLAEVRREAEEAAKDQRLLAALLEAIGPREGSRYARDDKGVPRALAELTAEERFAAAFRAWGLDMDTTPAAEAAARLRQRPEAVVTEVIPALDEWASQRRADRKPEAAWRRLADLATLLDDDPGSKRRELRAILARDRLPVERVLGVLSALLHPVPVPVELPLGMDRCRLRQLAEQTNVAVEPVLGLLTLARVLRRAGEEALAEQLLRAAIQVRPREVILYYTLGQLLTEQEPPRWAEAVEFYRAARALRPDLGVSLAIALLRGGRDNEGLVLLDRLMKEMPDNPYLYFTKGTGLYNKGDLDGAIACYHKAIALDPKLAPAHNNLGLALYFKHDLDGSIACYHRAIAVDPKLVQAHNNLGLALDDKHDLDSAIACYHKAIALDPKTAPAYYNLGRALYFKHDLDGAIVRFRQAIDLDAKNAHYHFFLGLALYDKHDWDGAIACSRKAIAIDPNIAVAHNNLGNALVAKRDLDGAIACYRRAIAIDPKLSLAHNNLGSTLREKGDQDGAIACYHKAIALDPKNAAAHNNLGNALWDKGDQDGAIACYRKAIALDAQFVQARDNLGRALDSKLPAVLQGKAAPADAGEAILLAQRCQQHKKEYVAAARLYADAFTAEPSLAADWNAQHRYNAACSAVLAAAGQSKDARLLPDKVVAMFRHWALGWLRDDLAAYAKIAPQNDPTKKRTIRQRLAEWRRNPDLASVRDRAMLNRLPDKERTAWHTLWYGVDELEQRLTNKGE
jgi:tetratricopeptide (TPR) repeat protein